MNIGGKLELVGTVIKTEGNELSLDMELCNLESWNSITFLELMVMLKKHGFNYKLNEEQINNLKTVGDIVEIMG